MIPVSYEAEINDTFHREALESVPDAVWQLRLGTRSLTPSALDV
jgi:hypothetical protein